MSRAAMQQALEALMMMRDKYEEYTCPEYACPACNHADAAITTLRKALAEPDLDHCPNCGGPADNGHDRCVPPNPYFCSKCMAEPEQEPVCKVIDERGGVDWISFVPPAGTPLYTAPPQRKHITDGSPCWCNPDVIEEEGGNVIVHNYDDNWQQYAKPGETAQQCIERHRGEQDALMKLYATPRKPQTTHWEGCEAVHPECRKPEQEPVAHSVVEPLRPDEYQCRVSVKWVGRPVSGPLYTAPTPQPDTDCHAQGICQRSGYSIAPTPRRPLTDEEITDAVNGMGPDVGSYEHRLARAVIAAYEAKQGEQT